MVANCATGRIRPAHSMVPMPLLLSPDVEFAAGDGVQAKKSHTTDPPTKWGSWYCYLYISSIKHCTVYDFIYRLIYDFNRDFNTLSNGSGGTIPKLVLVKISNLVEWLFGGGLVVVRYLRYQTLRQY